MIQKANALWQGDGKTGKGHLSTQSGILQQTPYSFKQRFEGAPGTNPEELIAAAHAGCFTMKLSFVLEAAGFIAEQLDTQCQITFENGSVTRSHLILKANIPNISQETFELCVKDAESNCPISQLLKTQISSEAQLLS